MIKTATHFLLQLVQSLGLELILRPKRVTLTRTLISTNSLGTEKCFWRMSSRENTLKDTQP